MIMSIITSILLSGAAANASRGDNMRPLLDAMRQVESSGNDNAVGDTGRSRGPYQIGRAYWQDACEQGRVDWDYAANVNCPARCEQIIRWYWKRYAPTNATPEMLARIHNGGPNGHRKAATKPYWRKVQAAMNGETK